MATCLRPEHVQLTQQPKKNTIVLVVCVRVSTRSYRCHCSRLGAAVCVPLSGYREAQRMQGCDSGLRARAANGQRREHGFTGMEERSSAAAQEPVDDEKEQG